MCYIHTHELRVGRGGGGDLCSKQLALMPLVNMYGMNEEAGGRITGVTHKVLET